MRRELKYFTLGLLAAVGGTVLAQSFTSVLNLRVLEILDIDGELTLNDDPGTAGQALVSGGNGQPPTWDDVSTSPGGNDTEVQFNNMGAFAGDSTLTFDGSALTVPNLTVTGSCTGCGGGGGGAFEYIDVFTDVLLEGNGDPYESPEFELGFGDVVYFTFSAVGPGGQGIDIDFDLGDGAALPNQSIDDAASANSVAFFSGTISLTADALGFGAQATFGGTSGGGKGSNSGATGMRNSDDGPWSPFTTTFLLQQTVGDDLRISGYIVKISTQ